MAENRTPNDNWDPAGYPTSGYPSRPKEPQKTSNPPILPTRLNKGPSEPPTSDSGGIKPFKNAAFPLTDIIPTFGRGGYKPQRNESENEPIDPLNYTNSFPRQNSSVRSSMSSRMPRIGSTVSFHDIRYEVKVKKWPWSKAVHKPILKGVTGVMLPGVNAIMGPTGSGKSSLLDVLAGRKNPKFLQGQVLIDGKPQPKNFKCISGYVVQDDIVMGTLTVRENLHFSASLRLNSNVNHEEKKKRIDEILEELGLTHVADSKIGTELIRGVSGGERKRTNIGMELITSPKVLFLDEPTTGLDAFTAGQVISTLKSLSLGGRTIIFSIHQPKYSIYKLFDTLTLVCKGNIVYHGRSRETALNYFTNLNFVCEEHDNPPDFFMDILHAEPRTRKEGWEKNKMPKVRRAKTTLGHSNKESIFFSKTSGHADIVVDTDVIHDINKHHEKLDNVANDLADKWNNSTNGMNAKLKANIIYESYKNSNGRDGNKEPEVQYSSSFMRQMKYVCWRTGLNLLRDPNASIVQTVVYLFFAISMGVVYYQMGTSLESGFQNRAGLFFFSALQVIFVNIGSIEVFIKERVIFIHENSSGYYRVSAYFLAKILCDVLPTKTLPLILFMPITYFMVGLRYDAGAFFIFEILMNLTTLAAAGIALLVGATSNIFSIANVIISISYVFMMVFGGYLINLQTMGAWLSWLRYLSIFRYCWGGLLINEMPPLTFCPTTNTTTATNVDTRTCVQGTTYLRDLDLPYATSWDLWQNVLGLSILATFFYILCYVQLLRINKFK